MRVKEISYAMLRVTAQFENDRVEFTLELDEDDDVGSAVRQVKRLCERALVTHGEDYEGF